MEQQDGKYFTIWYGVYDRQTRQLVYSGGGHPPAILLSGSSPSQLTMQLLKGEGPIVGAFDGLEFGSTACSLDASNRLYLYSDGAFEICQADGSMWELDTFVELMGKPAYDSGTLDRLIEHITGLCGGKGFDDDVSLLEVEIGTVQPRGS